MSTDESYDPHARMHESFPRSDSGSTQMAGEVIELPQTIAQKLSGNIAQSVNERSLANIAGVGAGGVDKTNLVLGPGMRKPQPK